MASTKFSRRKFLGTSAAALAGGVLGVPSLARAGGRSSNRVKNIIFCVSDGMSAATPTMVDHLSLLNTGKHSYWASLMKEEYAVNGLQDTRSLNSVVTDSSAASSSWGSGRHIWNGQVNMFPDGTELRTLTDLMQSAGVRTGLVTTSTITHATPAGFAVNCESRGLEGLIAERYLEGGVHVLMGGGDRFFSPTIRPDGKDLYADFAKKGYRVVKDRDATMGLKADRILGIYSNSHVPFMVDQVNDPELMRTVPTLAEMSRVAIDNLQGGPNGFLLQIEGAKIDHAAHADDLAGMIYDQIAFEDAVRVAVEFALQDGETLVVVTSDHGCGNPGLNGFGRDYDDSTPGLLLLNGMKSSYGPLVAAIGLAPTVAKVREVVEEKLGIELKESEAQELVDTLAGKSPYAGSIFYGYPQATLGVILGNHTKVTWTSTMHTSDHVLVTAVGPGSEDWGGLTQNISMFDTMLGYKGIEWSNPTMTREEARRAKDKARGPSAEMLELYAAADEFHPAG
jgi:alkaline phosphatase